MSAQKTITVSSPYQRTVTLSPVNWARAWCSVPRSEEGYPGSYMSLLCPACRRRCHAWRQENYRRGLAEQPRISLSEWAQKRGHPPVPQDARGSPVFLGRQVRTAEMAISKK